MLARFVIVLRRSVEACTALLFTFFIVVIVAQVFFRYLLNDSLVWAEEVVRFALYWMTMLTIAVAADRRGHIVMDLLEASLGPLGRRRLECINAALSVVFLAILAFFGIQLIGQSWETMTAMTDIPMSLVYLATPLGCTAAIILTIDAARRPRRDDRSADSPGEGVT